MTRIDADSTLVYANRPPDLDGRPVDVRPGTATAFDSIRHHAVVHVLGPDGERRTYEHREIPAVLAAVETHLRETDGAFVRFGNRAWLREVWSTRTVAAVERRLVAAARREGATFVAWTSADPPSTDGAVYDAVID